MEQLQKETIAETENELKKQEENTAKRTEEVLKCIVNFFCFNFNFYNLNYLKYIFF